MKGRGISSIKLGLIGRGNYRSAPRSHFARDRKLETRESDGGGGAAGRPRERVDVRISDPDTVKSRQQQSVTNLSLSTLPDVALNTNREKRTAAEIADANVEQLF